MTESHAETDLGVGLAIAFGALAVIGALGTTATSYLYVLEADHGIQVLSGVAFALSVLFAGLAVTALHVYGE